MQNTRPGMQGSWMDRADVDNDGDTIWRLNDNIMISHDILNVHERCRPRFPMIPLFEANRFWVCNVRASHEAWQLCQSYLSRSSCTGWESYSFIRHFKKYHKRKSKVSILKHHKAKKEPSLSEREPLDRNLCIGTFGSLKKGILWVHERNWD